jgi:hypothetical protein
MPNLADITISVTGQVVPLVLSAQYPQEPASQREDLNVHSSSIAAEIRKATESHVTFLAIAGNRVIGNRRCQINSVATWRNCPHATLSLEFLSQGKPFQDAKDHELVAYADGTNVLPEWQHVGVATKLANECDDWLKRHSIHYVSGFFSNDPSGAKGFQAFQQRKGGSGVKIATHGRHYFYRHI